MPDLDFGETDEDAILVLKGFADRVNSDLYNHGTKGLLTTFNMFVTAHASQERERERQQQERHRENSTKLNILVAIATIGLFIIAAATLFVTYEENKHSLLGPAQLFHSQSLEPVLSYSQHSQDAQIPLNP